MGLQGGSAVPARAGHRYVLRVDGKGRITIPLPVREALGIEPGDLVELAVDVSARTVAIRPAAMGVLASYRVSLSQRKELVDAISTILEEGSDLRYAECWELECVVEVFVIDAVMAEKIAERLRTVGVKVVEYGTR